MDLHFIRQIKLCKEGGVHMTNGEFWAGVAIGYILACISELIRTFRR